MGRVLLLVELRGCYRAGSVGRVEKILVSSGLKLSTLGCFDFGFVSVVGSKWGKVSID